MSGFKMPQKAAVWSTIKNLSKCQDISKGMDGVVLFTGDDYYVWMVGNEYVPLSRLKQGLDRWGERLGNANESTFFINREIVHTDRVDTMKDAILNVLLKVRELEMDYLVAWNMAFEMEEMCRAAHPREYAHALVPGTNGKIKFGQQYQGQGQHPYIPASSRIPIHPVERYLSIEMPVNFKMLCAMQLFHKYATKRHENYMKSTYQSAYVLDHELGLLEPDLSDLSDANGKGIQHHVDFSGKDWPMYVASELYHLSHIRQLLIEKDIFPEYQMRSAKVVSTSWH